MGKELWELCDSNFMKCCIISLRTIPADQVTFLIVCLFYQSSLDHEQYGLSGVERVLWHFVS